MVNDNQGTPGARARFPMQGRRPGSTASLSGGLVGLCDKVVNPVLHRQSFGRGGLRIRNLDTIWSEDEYKLQVSWIAGGLSRAVFQQHLRFIKFADNTLAPNPNSRGWTPYWKVQHLLDQVTVASTIDNCMIAYARHAIDWTVTTL